jgi:hypothetical protein
VSASYSRRKGPVAPLVFKTYSAGSSRSCENLAGGGSQGSNLMVKTAILNDYAKSRCSIGGLVRASGQRGNHGLRSASVERSHPRPESRACTAAFQLKLRPEVWQHG